MVLKMENDEEMVLVLVWESILEEDLKQGHEARGRVLTLKAVRVMEMTF